jgi:excisionase family DNA binding protein
MSTVAVGRPNEQAVPLPVIAKRLPISEAMFRDLVRAGRVPATKIGRTWWIFESDVRASELGALLR